MSEVATRRSGGGYLDRPQSSSLADVINIILDKGLVIDAFVRVSVVGIELITIDARIVIASVDTYLRFAEATNRLDLEQTGGRQLPELIDDISESGSHGKTKGLVSGAKDALTSNKDDKDDGEDDDKSTQRSRRRTSRQESS
ncbi:MULTISPECIES: gas vesicle protein GvpJ [unclassified Isoptericola]|uniref:gas vesicle protein GvpJ n=1 Tax=Isoptericola sp. NPDC057191 TaxID=3346041 RepID=UPI003634EFC1